MLRIILKDNKGQYTLQSSELKDDETVNRTIETSRELFKEIKEGRAVVNKKFVAEVQKEVSKALDTYTQNRTAFRRLLDNFSEILHVPNRFQDLKQEVESIRSPSYEIREQLLAKEFPYKRGPELFHQMEASVHFLNKEMTLEDFISQDFSQEEILAYLTRLQEENKKVSPLGVYLLMRLKPVEKDFPEAFIFQLIDEVIREDPSLAAEILKTHSSNLKDKEGLHLLLRSAILKGDLDLFKTLINDTQAKKEIDQDLYGNSITPLFKCVDLMRIEWVTFLLEAGADPNTASKPMEGSEATNPLSLAVEKRYLEMIELLLNFQASAFNSSPNPFEIAINQSDYDTLALLLSKVNDKEVVMKALSYAISQNDLEAVKTFRLRMS